jgi:hypothetical protein
LNVRVLTSESVFRVTLVDDLRAIMLEGAASQQVDEADDDVQPPPIMLANAASQQTVTDEAPDDADVPTLIDEDDECLRWRGYMPSTRLFCTASGGWISSRGRESGRQEGPVFLE